MAKPKYTVHTAAGEPVAGDDRLDGYLKDYAQNHQGYITDRAGEVVFDARPEVTTAAGPEVPDLMANLRDSLEETRTKKDPAVAAPTDNTNEENEQ